MEVKYCPNNKQGKLTSNSANVTAINNRTSQGFKRNCQLQGWLGSSKIEIYIFYTNYQTQKHKKYNPIPTQILREEMKICGVKMLCTTSYIEPTLDGVLPILSRPNRLSHKVHFLITMESNERCNWCHLLTTVYYIKLYIWLVYQFTCAILYHPILGKLEPNKSENTSLFFYFESQIKCFGWETSHIQKINESTGFLFNKATFTVLQTKQLGFLLKLLFLIQQNKYTKK